MTRVQLLDAAERVGATAAEAGIGVAVTYLSHLPVWWAVALVPVLSGVKGWLATRLTGSPSLVPARPQPAVSQPAE